MAKVDIRLPEEFLIKISRLGEKTDEIIPKVLEAGAAVVLPKMKANLRDSIGRNTKYKSRSSGELLEALGVSPARQDKDGNFNVKIGFREPRKDGGVNAKLANILEYGKSGQPPKPFLKPAKAASRKPCIQAMEQKLEQEIENL
ncbi:MAG TPA: HK97-gp10 family putative phage morphogenesis protein [Caproicibacter sp.]|nr:HK97-gp10 family putative phage morphogenesis protein [Caproicibacter sp.]